VLLCRDTVEVEQSQTSGRKDLGATGLSGWGNAGDLPQFEPWGLGSSRKGEFGDRNFIMHKEKRSRDRKPGYRPGGFRIGKWDHTAGLEGWSWLNRDNLREVKRKKRPNIGYRTFVEAVRTSRRTYGGRYSFRGVRGTGLSGAS